MRSKENYVVDEKGEIEFKGKKIIIKQKQLEE
jgi:CRISPR/Cas system-associated endonuclease Cas1